MNIRKLLFTALLSTIIVSGSNAVTMDTTDTVDSAVETTEVVAVAEAVEIKTIETVEIETVEAPVVVEAPVAPVEAPVVVKASLYKRAISSIFALPGSAKAKAAKRWNDSKVQKWTASNPKKTKAIVVAALATGVYAAYKIVKKIIANKEKPNKRSMRNLERQYSALA
jgi:hypothetical protein